MNFFGIVHGKILEIVVRYSLRSRMRGIREIVRYLALFGPGILTAGPEGRGNPWSKKRNTCIAIDFAEVPEKRYIVQPSFNPTSRNEMCMGNKA